MKTIKLQRSARKRELVSVTPLIDVVFILLIFFMIAGSIEAPDVFPVELPASTSEVAGPDDEFVILLRADGVIAIENQEVTEDELVVLMIDILRTRPETLIQLKADAEIEAVKVIEVMELLRSAGAEFLVLLTVGATPASQGSAP